MEFMNNFIKNSGLLFFSLIVSLLAIEVGIRLVVPAERWKFFDATVDWKIDSELGWVNKSDLRVKYIAAGNKPSIFETNNDGLISRSSRERRSDHILRIMLFGDSTVAGRAVARAEAIDSQLEKALKSIGIEAEVINSGVNGYSTDQILLFMKRIVPLYKPDIVVYGLCTNDFSGNAVSSMYGINKPRFVAGTGGELEPISFQQSEKIETFGANNPKKWIQYSALYRFLQPLIVNLRDKLADQKILSPEDYYTDPIALNEMNEPVLSLLIAEMQRTAAAVEAKFFFYSHPALEEVWEPYINKIKELKKPHNYDGHRVENKLFEVAKKNNLLFCPLVEFFIKNKYRGPFHLLPRDPHCNASGYAVIAEALAYFLVENQMIKNFQQRSEQSSEHF